jgi:MFS family permease
MNLLQKEEFFVLKRNILLVSIIGFVWSATHTLWHPFLPKFYESLGASIIIVGILVSLSEGIESFSGLLGGYLSDRLGRKKIIIVSGYLIIISSLLFFLSNYWIQLILPIVILAIASKCSAISRRVLVVDSLPSHKRARGFSTYFFLTSLPSLFLAPVGGWLVQTYGMINGVKLAFAITAMLCFFVFTLSFPFLRETLKRKSVTRKIGKIKTTFKFLKTIPKSLKALIIANTLQYFGAAVPTTFIVFYVLDIIHIIPLEFGLLLSIEALISLFVILPAGKIADKIGRKPVISVGYFLSFLAMILIIFAKNFWHLVIVFIIGAIATITTPSFHVYVADLTPIKNRAKMMGLTDFLGDLSAVPGPVIGGILYFIFPKLIFIFASVIYFLSFLIVLKFVKEVRK